jgi:hypothetical protein
MAQSALPVWRLNSTFKAKPNGTQDRWKAVAERGSHYHFANVFI